MMAPNASGRASAKLRQPYNSAKNTPILPNKLAVVNTIALRAESPPALIDNFSNAKHMTNGMPRMIFSDKDAGGAVTLCVIV